MWVADIYSHTARGATGFSTACMCPYSVTSLNFALPFSAKHRREHDSVRNGLRLYVRVSEKGADSGLRCAVPLACELSPPSLQAPGGRLNGSVWIPPYRPVAPAC